MKAMMSQMKQLQDAIKEANRCLNCRVPQCQKGCPIENDIPEFISALAGGDLGNARRILARKTNLPAVCGRVCAHEKQCEGNCVLNKTGKPIQIGMLEKIVADFAFDMELPFQQIKQKTRGNVAVIGSGPAGLTVAGDLAKQGFSVTVFEAQEEAGGVMLYGIPSFRLSKKVVRREVSAIEALGVRFKTEQVIGVDITVDELFTKGYDAVFIGSGTAVAKDLRLPGRDVDGIVQSSYLLRMAYLNHSGQVGREEIPVNEGDTVLVIGAGNVGMDSARMSQRMGAKSVTVICRSDEENMTALPSEHEAAEKEGVKFLYEAEPVAYHGRDGDLTGLEVTIDGKNEIIPVDKVLLAIGSKPANRIVSTTTGIDVDEFGYVIINEHPYGMTTRKGVFAGGDVVHKPATVVLAMREAKKVAVGIMQYIDAIKLLGL